MWVGTVVVVGLLGVLALSRGQERAVGVAGADSSAQKVKCDQGQTLTEALKKAKPGDTLQVTGTCHERVIITTDRLTLDGGGRAVLDGGGGPTEFFEGVVTIDGVPGVTLMGFTTRNQTGLLVDGAGTLRLLVPDASNPSSIENNTDIDVDLKFGTRVTFDGVTIGKIACDATVLSRGTTVCP
jgi:nitrous oxidase accessory protein NosD